MVRIAPNCDIPNLSKIVDETFDSLAIFDCDDYDVDIADEFAEDIGD